MTIVDFLTGLIIGTLLGLVLAPLLQAWVAWRVIRGSGATKARDRLLQRLYLRP